MAKRLYYIDWLRILAVLLLLPFHTSRVFNGWMIDGQLVGEDFYIKSVHISEWLAKVLGFISTWHMQLLFVLAGASAYFSLKRRSGGQFAGERVTRLFVPLVFGMLVLMPPQTWVGGQFNSGYTGSFFTYITSGAFLVPNFGPEGDYYGGLGIGHFWFILFLLVYSLVALPLFAWGRAGGRGGAAIQRFSRFLAKPWGWLFAGVVIWLSGAVPELAGKNLVYYLVFFILGFAIVADDAFSNSAKRWWWFALVVGFAGCLFWDQTGALRDSLPDPSFARAGMDMTGALGTWLAIVGLLGVGRRYLDKPAKSLPYLAEASYPLYILHQTVIVVAAFYLLPLISSGVAQWLAILVAAVAGSFALYEIVRRVGVFRFLFGMRAKPKIAQVTLAEERSAAVS